MTFAIISAERDYFEPSQNAIRSQQLAAELAEIAFDFHPVLGSYKGTTEKSFLVELADREDYDYLRDLAQKNEQESILIVDKDGSSTLLYMDNGEAEHIGQWQWAGLEQPDTDAWTLLAGQYFYVV